MDMELMGPPNCFSLKLLRKASLSQPFLDKYSRSNALDKKPATEKHSASKDYSRREGLEGV
jgi:hypothetical protein